MEEKTKKKKINYLILLVGLLLVFAVVQAFQISASEGFSTSKTSGSSASNAPAGQQNSEPVKITTPVTMVGGC